MKYSPELTKDILDQKDKFFIILRKLFLETRIIKSKNVKLSLKRFSYPKRFYLSIIKNTSLTNYQRLRLSRNLIKIDVLLHRLKSKFITIDILSQFFTKEQTELFDKIIKTTRRKLKDLLDTNKKYSYKNYRKAVVELVKSVIYLIDTFNYIFD